MTTQELLERLDRTEDREMVRVVLHLLQRIEKLEIQQRAERLMRDEPDVFEALS